MRKESKKATYEDWMEMVAEIKLAVELSYPISLFQATVHICNSTGISYGATDYERREAISNAVYGTGFHIDRNNKVSRLSDLIGLREVSIGESAGRPCVRFRIHAKLEEGKEHLSDKTLEWLDADGRVVNADRNLDVNVEPIVETSRALDAYMTDVDAEVYRRLALVVPELRLRRLVLERYHNSQYAPLFAAGRDICFSLAREGIIPDFGDDHLRVENSSRVIASLQHYLDDDGKIDSTVFVTVIPSLGRAGVVSERNCEYGNAVWVSAANVHEALIEYERLKL